MVGLPACLCVKFGILIKAMMNNKEADVIQKMIDSGAKVMPYLLSGQYINVNSPEDLSLAKKMS